MARFKLTIEYDGGPFCGWQRQPDLPSVQACLEKAVQTLTDGVRTEVAGAGRTDAGVHALGQVAHVDLDRDISADKLREALNALLRPNPIGVINVVEVDDDFHARFSAVSRSYLYQITNVRWNLALDAGRMWRVPARLDHEAMHEAAQALVGQHDFSTFRDAQCQAESPVKSFDEINVTRYDDVVEVQCKARSFLHRQVRSIVGSLVEVGRGKQKSQWVGDILKAADRSMCGPVAPPDGLYLVDVGYPD